jgi:thioredoxin reductase (NADPH)
LRAGAILQKRAFDNPKIQFIWNSIVTEIKGIDGVSHIHLKNTKNEIKSEVDFDGIFIFIGHTPNTELFKGQIELDENGFVVVDNRSRTNIPGVFAAGEVCDPLYRQVVTSAGMGAAAAIEAIRYLETE